MEDDLEQKLVDLPPPLHPWITKTLVFDVSKQKSQDRMKRLAEILFTRGARAYQEFCETVKDEGEFDLAYCLQRDAYNVEKENYLVI